jgi:hypothetical protein
MKLTALLLALATPTALAQTAPWVGFANLDTNGVHQSGQWWADECAMSANGRFVGFTLAAPLTPGDTNNNYDGHIRDLELGITRRVGKTATLTPNGFVSGHIGLSSSGRYVSFVSSSTNLAPGTVGYGNVYVHDMVVDTVSIVTRPHNAAGDLDGSCSVTDISDDGRYVVYFSTAQNLVAQTASGQYTHCYLTDRQTGLTRRISSNAAGSAGNFHCYGSPRLSGDGRFAFFSSWATNLVPNDANPDIDIFRYELATGALDILSRGLNGAQANGHWYIGDVSTDGRWMAFYGAFGAFPGIADTNLGEDTYVRDNLTGALQLVTRDASGAAVGGGRARISADGRHCLFNSGFAFVPGKTTNVGEYFVCDLAQGTYSRVSASPTGADPSGLSAEAAISGNARRVAFVTQASNIVLPDPFPYWTDCIVRDRGAPTVPQIYCVARPNSLGCQPQLGYVGTPSMSMGLGFTLTASNLYAQKTGMLFYGVNGAASLPFYGGFLCVQAPLRRTPVRSTGGSLTGDDCTGSLGFDFNLYLANGSDPMLSAGTEVWAQFYSRDPGFTPPNNVNFSPAIDFVIQP